MVQPGIHLICDAIIEIFMVLVSVTKVLPPFDKMIVFLVCVAAIFAATEGYSTGAPKNEACTTMHPGHGNQIQDTTEPTEPTLGITDNGSGTWTLKVC